MLATWPCYGSAHVRWSRYLIRPACNPVPRIQRDVAVRGRDFNGVIEQYTKFVKPAFDQFVAPSRKFADIIIPWQR